MSKKITPYQIMNLLQGKNHQNWIISGDKLKINIKHFGLDWYEGIKQSLQKLIDGKNEKEVEKVMHKTEKQVLSPHNVQHEYR
jgi:hypothetical protein